MSEEKVMEQKESQNEFDFGELEFDEPVEQEPEQEPEPEPEAEPILEQEPSKESDEQADESEPPRQELDPGLDDVVDERPDEPDGSDDLEALREQNKALLAHIESLSGQLVSGITNPPAMQQVEEERSKADVPQTQAEIMNFLENTSIDDLLEDPTKFNNVLNNVATQSQQRAVQVAVQQVLRSVPELVMGYITRHSAMNRMVDDFYKENPDLTNVKQTVAAVANDIHSKNPGLGVEEVFKKSADETRRILGMHKRAQDAMKREAKKPAFAKAGGARKPTPAVDPLQREINDLLSGEF